MVDNTVETVLGFLSKIPDLFRSAKSDSLIEFTKPTRVEPIVLMEGSLASASFTPDLMNSLTAIFSGYYLQAVALSVNIGRIDVIGLLDKVNPNRSISDNILKGVLNSGTVLSMASRECYKHGWPDIKNLNGVAVISNENIYREVNNALDPARTDEDDEAESGTGTVSRSGKDMIKYAQEATSLSVGKLLEVEIESEGHRATFPITVRLIVTLTTERGLGYVLTLGSGPKTVKERWHAWRSGQLTFWRDLVLCQDLIDNHKKALISDKSGIYQASTARDKKNKFTALLSGVPSVATASNILIFTSETQKAAERVIGGRFKDFRVRERIFKQTFTMLMVSVNLEWETVTIFHRSVEFATELSFADLKIASKGNGINISDVLKAYTLGQAPKF